MESLHRVEAREAGRDYRVAVVGGGQRPHVGVVVVAQPYPSRGRPGEKNCVTISQKVKPRNTSPSTK